MLSADNIQDIYTLSPMQEGMYFHALYDQTSLAHFDQVAYRFRGEINVACAQQSVNRLVQRHQALRTVFRHKKTSRPVQVVLKAREVEFKYRDIRALAGWEAKEQFLRELKEQDRRRGFDLTRDVMLRVQLVQLTDNICEFIWSTHHILMDGWCIGILTTEYFQLYNSLKEGYACHLPGVTPFSAYIQWLESQDKAAAGQYWQGRLEGYTTAAALPGRVTARGRQAPYRNAKRVHSFDEATTARLRELAARHGVTLNTVFQVLWSVMLSRYNDCRDVAFGTVVAGRPSTIEGVESIVGLFANLLPVRISYGPETRFDELLRTAQEHAAGSEPYQFYALADIQAAQPLGQDLIDHIFVFQNFPVEAQLEGLCTEPDGPETPGSLVLLGVEAFSQTNYDFSIRVQLGPAIQVEFIYNANAFQEGFVENIGQQLDWLVAQVLADGQVKADALTLLPPARARQWLAACNPPPSAFPHQATMHGLFEEQVRKAPGQPAVVSGNTTLTYEALNRQANRLAHYLRDCHRVKPDDVVGILLDKSELMIVAMLGVLKAGAAYLPVDPAYPAERIAYLTGDARAGVLLTESAHLFDIDFYRGELVVLDIQLPEMNGPDHNPVPVNAPGDLAYVIYTSGSSGKPKGVMIEHHSNVNMALDQVGRFRVTPADKVLQFASVSFDASVYEICMALYAGATVVIADTATIHNTRRFVDYLAGQGVTVATLPPSYLGSLPLDELRFLRVIITAGEAAIARDAYHCSRFAEYYNAYGPTECAVCTSVHRVQDAPGAGSETIPIGRPIANAAFCIVDRNGHVQPAGVPGEIGIAGEGLARGYLHQPGLTARTFVSHPLVPGGRLYLTGDVGRWLPDGSVEFLGRRDSQVKIRGRRIELGEIENCLGEYPGIDQAVVTVANGQTGPQLVAYLVPGHDHDLDPEQVRQFLAGKLPDYLVPTLLVPISRVPLTHHGKIDYQALPSPFAAGPAGPESRREPASALEESLLRIWRDILQKEHVGTEDNFFTLGGHSLKAIQLTTLVQKEMRLNLELNDIFRYPTVAGLARVLETAAGKAPDAIVPVGHQPYYELSHAQRRIWLACVLDKDSVAYNLPGAYVLAGELNTAAFCSTFNALVDRHESLRTTFVSVEGAPRQRIHPAGDTPFAVALTDLRGAAQRENLVRTLAEREAAQPFDLAAGPLVRAHLVQLEDRKHVFLLTMHHIISDAWSMGVIIKEVLALYKAYCKGEGNPLAPLPIQYKDYAAWERRRLDEAGRRKHRDYWLSRLSEPVPPLQLPLDFPRPVSRTSRAANVQVVLEAGTANALRALCRQYDVTMYVALLSLVEVLLHKATGQRDMVVGSPIAVREHPLLEAQVGLYLNVMPLRVAPDPRESFTDLLGKTKTLTTGAFLHQAYPLDWLLEELNRTRTTGSLFDVGFTWQNAEEMVLGQTPGGLEGITVSSLELPGTQVKTDIWFTAREEAQQIDFTITYNLSLFRRSTIESLASTLTALAAAILKAPEGPLGPIISQLPIQPKGVPTMASESVKVKHLEKFFSVEKRAVDPRKTSLVNTSFLAGGQSYPLVVEPSAGGLVLHAWIKDHKEWVRTQLLRHGAILFRNFPVQSTGPFQEFVQALSDQRMEYVNRTSPRSQVEDKLYTSTDYPADQVINMHNELSYSHSWPMQIIFFCVRPAEAGGETPIADSRRVLGALPEPVQEKFRRKGIRYERNMSKGLGLSWRDVYQTDERARVEAYCRTYGIQFEWGDDDQLRISWKRPAILDHPVTGEPVWFNHGFFYNIRSMDRQMKDLFRNIHALPFGTYYGDGEEIEPEVIEEIRMAYEKTKISFPWQQGDILLLDNMLMAHGRNPFAGERKIVVAMNEPFEAPAQ